MKPRAVIALLFMGIVLSMPYAEAVWHVDVVGEHTDLHHHTTPLGSHADFLHCSCEHGHLFPQASTVLPDLTAQCLKSIPYVLDSVSIPHLQGLFKPPKA